VTFFDTPFKLLKKLGLLLDCLSQERAASTLSFRVPIIAGMDLLCQYLSDVRSYIGLVGYTQLFVGSSAKEPVIK
jgi:hypothetical protein